jgi:hypothetical protein
VTLEGRVIMSLFQYIYGAESKEDKRSQSVTSLQESLPIFNSKSYISPTVDPETVLHEVSS